MDLVSRVFFVVCSVIWLHPLPVASQSVSPPKPITRLSVEIKTRNEKNAKIGGFHLLSGSDHVWLDLGFKAWGLSKIKTASGARPFRKNGAIDRWENLPLPADEVITTDDIFEIRLEKKGIGGFTHAADGIDGDWKPESVTLFVNGEPFGGPLAVLPPGESLYWNRPAWRHLFRPFNAQERFLHGLRIEPQDDEGNGWFTGLVAILTTPFKKMRVSGWQNGPLEQYLPNDPYTSDGEVKSDPPIDRAAVEGVLYEPPHLGTDGYVTLDLRLEKVTTYSANGGKTEHLVNTTNGLPHRRFIRVEYLRIRPGKPWDNRYRTEKWSVGDRFYAEGPVQWDTDEMGFYEIHPELGERYLQRLGVAELSFLGR